jgi:hypothetical protein
MRSYRRKFAIQSIASVLTYSLLGTASAQFGGLLGGGKGSGGSGNIEADVKSFLDRSFKIEITASKAYLAIVAAYAKEEDRAKYQSLFQDVGKLTDPKESGAKLQQVRESTEAEIKRLAESKDLKDMTAKLSEEKQKQIGKGVQNILYAAFQAKGVIDSGKSVITSVSKNPMDIPKVEPVKGAVERLGSAASLAGGAMGKFVDVLGGVNVKVESSGSSAKEESIDSLS